MSNLFEEPLNDVETAFQNGRRSGFAMAAMALAAVSFINLLGVEKSILAVVLALLAMHGAARTASARTWGRAAVGIAALHIVAFVVMVVLFHNQILQLVRQLHHLG